MRICYVSVDVVVPHFRGASTHAYELSKNLVRLGHEVYLVSRRLTALQSEFEELDGIKVRRLYRGIFFSPPMSSYLQLKEQKKVGLMDLIYRLYLFTIYALYTGIISADLIKRNNIDVIIERETSFGAGAIASMLTGRPLVLEMIGPRYNILSPRRASKILIYTKDMIPDKRFEKKLEIVTAAVDTELFKPDGQQREEIRKRYGLKSSKVIGYVGTFQAWHGIEELIMASKDLLGEHEEMKFLMVGPYFEEVENLTKRLGIRDSFIFTGPVSYKEVPSFINASDILVAPYNPGKSEMRRRYGIGSPLKIFEYMACAKPLIATSVKPITDVIHDGLNGVLVPPGDIDSLREALMKLIENAPMAESIASRARKDVVLHFSWESLARKIQDTFYEVNIGPKSR